MLADHLEAICTAKGKQPCVQRLLLFSLHTEKICALLKNLLSFKKCVDSVCHLVCVHCEAVYFVVYGVTCISMYTLLKLSKMVTSDAGLIFCSHSFVVFFFVA